MDFPWDLCHLRLEDGEREIGPTVRRTNFDDGAVAQRVRLTRQEYVRNARIDVPRSNLAAFTEWVRDHGADWFRFVDWHDGLTRQVRIRGGRVRLQYGGDALIEGGERFETARVVLEGFDDA